MSMRVATFATNRQMLSASLQTQARMANMQLQEASGLNSTDYGGLGADARTLVNLEVSAQRAARYEAAATAATGQAELIYNALDSMADLLTSFRAQITALQSTDATDAGRASLVSAAQTALEEMEELLNTRLNERYLFAGSDTSGAPVDLNETTFDLTTVDTGYYQGSGDPLSATVNDDRSITYGINADDSAFETTLRAFGSIASAQSDLSDIDLSAVLDLVGNAVDGLAGLQGGLSVATAGLERAISDQQDLQSFYQTQIVNLRDVDVTAVAAQLTAYETQLQASYAALAKIQSLSLLDYLR